MKDEIDIRQRLENMRQKLQVVIDYGPDTDDSEESYRMQIELLEWVLEEGENT